MTDDVTHYMLFLGTGTLEENGEFAPRDRFQLLEVGMGEIDAENYLAPCVICGQDINTDEYSVHILSHVHERGRTPTDRLLERYEHMSESERDNFHAQAQGSAKERFKSIEGGRC